MASMLPWSAQKIRGHYITIIRDFSLSYYLLFVMQNISLFSSTSDNMVAQMIAPFSKTRSLFHAVWEISRISLRNAIKMRDDLKDYVNSDMGSLPW